MEMSKEISDDEFIPFLQSLGVETFNKSFEWMLHDKDFGGVLRWLYHSLDHNNALTAREEYRYAELEKRGQLLSPEELESYIRGLKEEYLGICLPGDKEALEDVNFDISMQKERLYMLEKQEEVLKDLLKQNELAKDEIIQEVTKLHSAELQCSEDESAATEECLKLADEVENTTEDVIAVVADTLELYTNCNGDKEISRKFLTFGPFESYRQSQALFRSHFDLYTSKKFSGRKNNVTDEDLRMALVEAKSMEDRLTDAMLAYIESKAELSGEQAKVALVINYNNVHPSQIAACSMEAQSAKDILEQEECILEQQIQDAVSSLVEWRTRLAVETTAKSALNVREQLLSDLSHLHDCAHRALALDRVLYAALRHELRNLQDLTQFAAHLRQYAAAERDAVGRRIQSMEEISSEQASCEQKLKLCDPLQVALCEILGLPLDSDAAALVKAYNDLRSNVRELRSVIEDAFRRKEALLFECASAAKPLKACVFSGCTKQPHCWDKPTAALAHAVAQKIEDTDKMVLEASGKFTTVKNGDKQYMRKLWQWFVTDPAKLAVAVKGVQGKSYL